MNVRDKYQQYIGREITWKLLVELGLIDRVPERPQINCAFCGQRQYAKGLCLSHYNKDRRRSGKPGCAKCGKVNAILFVYAQDKKLYCPSCAQSLQPVFDKTQWSQKY